MTKVMMSAIMVLAMMGCMDYSGPEVVEVQGEPGARGLPGEPGVDGDIGPQGVQGDPGEDGIECAVDPNTLTMQYSWTEAEDYRRACNLENDAIHMDCVQEAKHQYLSCIVQTGPDASEDEGCMAMADDKQELCDENYEEDGYWCDHWYAKMVNKIPLRVCGVRIFDNSSGVLPVDGEGNYYMGVIESNDFDGDGITDWMEYLMGYNPCTPQSFGACIDDSDLDYDADGILNGEDEAPICNPDDPGEYQSDCV